MQKLLLSAVLLLCSFSFSYAQLNVTFVSNYAYQTDANDVWGYVDSLGNEYAVVGLRNGVSIIDLAVPAAPVQIAFFPGANSTWRDIKTWGRFAYVTTDQGADGLMVIDLTNLTANLWQPTLTLSSGASGTLATAHNIYMDENGYAYLSGANIGNSGVLILDVFSTPGTPIHIGETDDYYSHDSYVRGDTLYQF